MRGSWRAMAEVRPTKTDAQAQRVSPIKAWVRSTPFLRSAKRFGLRLGIGLAYWGAVGQRVRAWLFQSREVSNFTYDLTQLTKRYLSVL